MRDRSMSTGSALMIAAVPTATIETLTIAVVYISGAIIGLLVLYRR